MTRLTEEGRKVIADIADRHGISAQSAQQMLEAVAAGQGMQAQFNIPELGGMGQWSQGGMTMVGDMFNHGLKARVDALCADLAAVVRDTSVFAPAQSFQSQSQGSGSSFGGSFGGANSSLFVPAGPDWPAELGRPASVGSQNDMRYAYFPEKRRLALDIAGKITVYDTGEHQISGFGQAQSGHQSLSFNSQHGLVMLSSLPVVKMSGATQAPAQEEAEREPEAFTSPEVSQAMTEPPAPAAAMPDPAPRSQTERATEAAPEAMTDDQIFSRIEKLAGLFDKGILTQSEYEAKKAELLARL
ncbi:SHOCT domain-containing protein [Pseudooceanicola sp.]|uniref:SHOCT domain-containing protein n=1 Tax=Pseudooceanicola sp. TaxID=1914328 RepID=UPI004058C878